MQELLLAEADWFRLRHGTSEPTGERLLSDLTCLALRFGRASDVVADLTRQSYGVLNSETAFWFASQITSNLDLINETCRAVDRLLRLFDAALNADLTEEARCWAEDFSMEQPDDVRIELKFGIPPRVDA
ncbi:MAG: hypothetical protein CMJ15_01645 [Pelagibacterium sp.]|nr:hypothetical protein [Pelagibacterium sp.]